MTVYETDNFKVVSLKTCGVVRYWIFSKFGGAHNFHISKEKAIEMCNWYENRIHGLNG